MMDELYWERIDAIGGKAENVAVTVVIDLPDFGEKDYVEIYGTVTYETDEYQLQTAIPMTRFAPVDAINDDCALKFSIAPECSIVALKSASVEKIVSIPLEVNNRGKEIIEFLGKHNFKEVSMYIHVAITSNLLCHCIIERLPLTDVHAKLRISAR